MDITTLEKKINYEFKDKSYLTLALTHSSFNNKNNFNNERLEFFGDKVLGFVIADCLYASYFDKDEGFLSKFLSYLTSKETLSEVAEELEICSYIKKQDCNAFLGADAVEALIAAIYIDSLSMEVVREFILSFWKPYFNKYLNGDYYSVFNPKSAIQEWAQKNKLPLPCYIDIKKEGTEHNPIFYVKICIEGFGDVEGVGSSKKLAQKDASVKFIEKYNVL
jgi:ribonuclease-3